MKKKTYFVIAIEMHEGACYRFAYDARFAIIC